MRGVHTMDDAVTQQHQNRRAHMANERTFLAWMRTGVAIMSFGFVIEKFSLFMTKISSLSAHSGAASSAHHASSGYSAFFGMTSVIVGTLMGILAFVRYIKVRNDINRGSYRSFVLLDALLAACVLALGAFMALYLLHSGSSQS